MINYTTTLVYTNQFANADEENLLAGNVIEIKSDPVLQKISSEKNLYIHLDEIQQKQDVGNLHDQTWLHLVWCNASFCCLCMQIRTYSSGTTEDFVLYIEVIGSGLAKPLPSSQAIL